MSVAVYVMPLSTWLTGRFRTVWGPDDAGGGPARPTRSPEEVAEALERFGFALENFLGFRPEWDESGPARSATVFSLEGFSLPTDLARRWAYRLRLPLLCSLEPPQIWLPVKFDPYFHFPSQWSPGSEVAVASLSGVLEELGRLHVAILKEERPDLDETGRVVERLRELAEQGLRHRAPLIVES